MGLRRLFRVESARAVQGLDSYRALSSADAAALYARMYTAARRTSVPILLVCVALFGSGAFVVLGEITSPNTTCQAVVGALGVFVGAIGTEAALKGRAWFLLREFLENDAGALPDAPEQGVCE
ncbi:MAG: hypothetical protein JXR94_14055 [Candidatus Hydrogenedentes bacterium]|nr:hypothetical protein [Candidatus Hydrogenedentota bacterium]